MKKLFLTLILLLTVYGCSEPKPEPTWPKSEGPTLKNGYIEYEVVTIDSCEYILGHDKGFYNGGFFLTHKGNCKNPIHLKNKITVTDTVKYKLIKE
jgi:hypothetical protein